MRISIIDIVMMLDSPAVERAKAGDLGLSDPTNYQPHTHGPVISQNYREKMFDYFKTLVDKYF